MSETEDSTVGDIMTDGRTKAVKSLVMVASMFVYCAMLMYSAVHNWALMTKGVPPDMILWAALGVVALEISAIFLPLGLHYSFHSALQRIVALGFYAVDLGLIFLNVILDYSLVSGAAIPGWMTIYLGYIVPATPIVAGLGWSLLWLLDPAQKERATVENLRASTREALANRIAQNARKADVSALVEAAAQNMAREIVAQTLGERNLPKLPPSTVLSYPPVSAYRPEMEGVYGGNYMKEPQAGKPEIGTIPVPTEDILTVPGKNGSIPEKQKTSQLYRMDEGRVEDTRPLP